MIATNGKNYSTFMPDHVPWFEANQVLKNTDLNDLVTYLDSHNRLTRTHLIGMGIVCGLEGSSTYKEGQAEIRISKGCGLTSEGYIILLPDTTLTHYKNGQTVSVTLFFSSEEEEKKKATSNTESSTYKVLELFQQKTKDDRIPLHLNLDGTTPHDAKTFQDFLANQVLVVVCESKKEQRDSCFNDCDNLGKDRRFAWRFFLLPKLKQQETSEANLSAETLLYHGFQMKDLASPWKVRNPENPQETGYSPEDVFEIRDTFFRRFNPLVKRFGFQSAADKGVGIYLTRIDNYKEFQSNYKNICQQAINIIDREFQHLFNLFSPLFSSFLPNTSADFRGLKGRLERNRLHPPPQKSDRYLPLSLRLVSAIGYTIFHDSTEQK